MSFERRYNGENKIFKGATGLSITPKESEYNSKTLRKRNSLRKQVELKKEELALLREIETIAGIY